MIEEKKKKLEIVVFQADTAKENRQFMAAAKFYSDAVSLARDLGYSDELNLYINELRRMNKLSLEHEFKSYSYTFNIPELEAKKIEEQLCELSKLSSEDLINTIGKSRLFIPNFDKIQEHAIASMPITMNIANVYSVDKVGNTLKGSTDGESLWMAQMCHIEIQSILKIYLKPLIEKSMINCVLTSDVLMQFIGRNNLFDVRALKLIEVGFERFFAEDFVSSLHILILQFESVFLSASNALGLKTCKINSGKEISTENITLSDRYLENDDCQSVWGKDFSKYLSFVMFDTLGIKLRHKIAHGEVAIEDCTFENCILVIYFYLSVASRVVQST